MRPARAERVEISDAQLWTETSGSGSPIVLAHGGPGMSDNLRPVGAMVVDLVAVHRYDQRACGRSTGVGVGQTVASAVADLDALRAHWGYEHLIVGGHSWGAALALFYALALPERVRAIVYISGPGATRVARPAARSRMERLTDAERERFSDAQTRAAAGDAAAATELAHLYWLTDFSDRTKAPDFAIEPMFDYPHNAEVAAALVASADEHLAENRLAESARRVEVPVLVLHGRDDPLPVENAIDLAALLPNAQLVVLEGVGHTPWLEDAACVERVLRQFVGSVSD
jgi:proline iminopeptidase